MEGQSGSGCSSDGKGEWLSRALQRNPEVKQLREALHPLSRTLAFTQLYRPGAAAVRHQLSDDDITKLVLQHLAFYEFDATRALLEKESKVAVVDNDIPHSRLLHFLRAALRDVEVVVDLTLDETAQCMAETELENKLTLEEMLYSMELVDRMDPLDQSADVDVWEEKEDTSIMEENGKAVKAATLNRLIIMLTSQNTEMAFVKLFLMTYPTFTTAEKLFSKLQERFHIPADVAESLGPSGALQIQLKVGNVLRKWFEEYPDHFLAADLAKQRAHFLKELEYNPVKTLSSLFRSLTNAIAKGEKRKDSKRLMFDRDAPYPKINLKTIFHPKLAWTDVSEEEVARQLCLMDFRIFCRIKPSELLNQSWSKPKLKHKSLNVLKMINRFNQVSMWVAVSVLKTPKIKQRAKVMAKLVKVADLCLGMRNYNAAMAIMAALNWSSVYRLKHTRKELPPSANSRMEELEKVLSSDNGYKLYRQHLADCNPPAIPYLGVSLTDLTYIDENSNNVDGMINIAKRRLIYNQISKIQQYQNTHYNLQPVAQIMTLLSNATPLDEQTLYSLSLKWEPRGAERHEVE